MFVNVSMSALWILGVYLAFANAEQRRKIRKLKQRIARLEYPTSDGSRADWFYQDEEEE